MRETRRNATLITGAHAIIYSKNPEADRAFLRDVLNFGYIDAGEGWLIFRLPQSEVAVHPADSNDVHELYLLCDNIQELKAALEKQQVTCSEIHVRDWGFLVQVTLPGGGSLGIYEPRHARP